jgi:hypothetical protein
MYDNEEFDEEIEDEEDDELELCMGEDGVLHMKEKRPTLSLAFEKEEQMIEFMAKCSVLGLKGSLIIPEGTRWNVENVSDRDEFLNSVNNKVDEFNEELK